MRLLHVIFTGSEEQKQRADQMIITSEQNTNTAPLRFVYEAKETAALLRQAYRVARLDAPVLLTGETGTGKEILARLIHEWSGRAGGECVTVNCAALTGDSINEYLFGSRRDEANESASADAGAAHKASNGTLLLYEIAALDLKSQGQLLRFIESVDACEAGAPETTHLNPRIIATSDRRLKQQVAKGLFREDLFYRLEALHLTIPPLRERPADVVALAEHFLTEACADASKKRVQLSKESLDALCRLPLKGNARELRSLVQLLVLTANDDEALTGASVEAVVARQTSQDAGAQSWAGCVLPEETLRYESNLIKCALETAGGSITRAARLLGMTHQGLASILQGRHSHLSSARKPPRQGPRKA